MSLFVATVIAPASPEVPYQQPQLAMDHRKTAIAFGSGNAIYVAVSSDHGGSFGKPVKVAEPGVISLGRHRGPRVVLTSGGLVVSAIGGLKGRGEDGDVLAWRSIDGGATWSEGVRVNDSVASAREGLHTMTSSGQTVFAAWLDLRSKGTKIFGSVSRDGGTTWSKNVLVYQSADGSVCECCHPSALIDAQGHVYVMFRNALAGSRDLYLARSTDGARSFAPAAKLGSGTWQLNACPMDGGGLAIAGNGKPVSVWRRARELYSSTDDRSEEKLGSGKDPAIVVTRKGLYAAWTGEGGLLVKTPGASEPVVLDKQGTYVQLAATPDGKVVATWEREGVILVEPLE
ncbi:MAG: exo-alpha-sialidase [Bryobacteraceae bacterium]|nr:exo-alpha-sialidase [Bryobacteraceae bacterium]